MAPNKRNNSSTPPNRESLSSTQSTSQSTTTQPTTTTSFSSSSTSLNTSRSASKSTKQAGQTAQDIAMGIWNNYVEDTPQRTKLIDVFMAFLVVVGGLQFVYCILVGNYPFNAFLSGFSATVGQFVLTASLRSQTNIENKSQFYSISPERAFADYIFGSMILHFFCVNFIN